MPKFRGVNVENAADIIRDGSSVTYDELVLIGRGLALTLDRAFEPMENLIRGLIAKHQLMRRAKELLDTVNEIRNWKKAGGLPPVRLNIFINDDRNGAGSRNQNGCFTRLALRARHNHGGLPAAQRLCQFARLQLPLVGQPPAVDGIAGSTFGELCLIKTSAGIG